MGRTCARPGSTPRTPSLRHTPPPDCPLLAPVCARISNTRLLNCSNEAQRSLSTHILFLCLPRGRELLTRGKPSTCVSGNPVERLAKSRRVSCVRCLHKRRSWTVEGGIHELAFGEARPELARLPLCCEGNLYQSLRSTWRAVPTGASCAALASARRVRLSRGL